MTQEGERESKSEQEVAIVWTKYTLVIEFYNNLCTPECMLDAHFIQQFAPLKTKQKQDSRVT